MGKQKKEIDPVQEFPEVEFMLYRLAWDAWGLPFAEAQSEAYYAFMLACATYQPDRGMKLSSWIYYKVERHLKTYRRRKRKDRLVPAEITDTLLNAAPRPERRNTLRDILEKMQESELSQEAQEMVSLLWESPAEVLDELPRDALKRVKDHLSYEYGYDRVYNDLTVFELKQYFRRS